VPSGLRTKIPFENCTPSAPQLGSQMSCSTPLGIGERWAKRWPFAMACAALVSDGSGATLLSSVKTAEDDSLIVGPGVLLVVFLQVERLEARPLMRVSARVDHAGVLE